MPINIYIQETFEKVHFICENIWDLPTQIEVETWLHKTAVRLEPKKYVADIGFKIKKDASGGGGGVMRNKKDGILQKMESFGYVRIIRMTLDFLCLIFRRLHAKTPHQPFRDPCGVFAQVRSYY